MILSLGQNSIPIFCWPEGARRRPAQQAAPSCDNDIDSDIDEDDDDDDDNHDTYDYDANDNEEDDYGEQVDNNDYDDDDDEEDNDNDVLPHRGWYMAPLAQLVYLPAGVQPGPLRVSDTPVSAENVVYEAFVVMGEMGKCSSALHSWRKGKVQSQRRLEG